jgi:hypothetical protein
MSLLQKTDLYADRRETADRRRPDHAFILALICVALALVIVNVMFGSAPSDLRLVGPYRARARKSKNRSNAAFSKSFDRRSRPLVPKRIFAAKSGRSRCAA